MKGYVTISEISKKWGIGRRRINALCNEGRIEGAIKFGNTWAIPENAVKPEDKRVISGEYRGWRNQKPAENKEEL